MEQENICASYQGGRREGFCGRPEEEGKRTKRREEEGGREEVRSRMRLGCHLSNALIVALYKRANRYTSDKYLELWRRSAQRRAHKIEKKVLTGVHGLDISCNRLDDKQVNV